MAPLDEQKGIWKQKGTGKSRATPKGRQVDDDASRDVQRLLGARPRRRDLLIEHLHLIQDAYGCLSAAHIAALADEMRMAQAEVYEVATFYAHFDVVREGESKPPALTIRVCDSLSCELAGAQALQDALEEGLDASQVRVLRAPCMGRCDTAPVLELGHRHIDHASFEKVQNAIADGNTQAEIPDYETFETYRKSGGYNALLKLREQGDWETVQEEILTSGLRGLGGAGFPSGKKWGFVRANEGPRYLAVNGDEGEPGTFKDRHYLERTPHLFLEGMLIAAWAVEAETCFIYMRDEYPAVLEILRREIIALEDAGIVAPGYVDLRRGAGAYICGEESAMIESIEGKRGLPRHRPPFVAQVGVFNRPTLVHNVETLHWVAKICREGPECLNSIEKNGRVGLRSYSVSGRVATPGVYLLPAGSTILDVIEAAGGMADGHMFKAYQPGGPSSGILPASMNDIPLDFDTLQPHGTFIGSAAVVVLSDKDKARDAALNMLKFFEDESCGQCTPCRSGCEKAVKLMQANTWDQELLEDLCTVMADASICGLGQAAPNPISAGHEALRRRDMKDVIETTVTFSLNGEDVTVPEGYTIWEAAHGRGLTIPHLCHKPSPGYRPDGNCRACMVEVEGERVLVASCIRPVSEGMVVKTDTERAEKSRKLVVELLAADQPDTAHDVSSHFWDMAAENGVEASRFPAIEETRVPILDDSHVAMRVNLDACIHCNLCVRACREVQVNDVIGMAGRGHDAKIVFDQDDPMGSSTCVACGECVQACPTGALMPATVLDENEHGDSKDYDREVKSVCPYCGVGCQLSFKIKDDKIKYVDGVDGPANENRLCVKGRFGFDYIEHPHRLTKPLIRRDDAPAKGLNVDPANIHTHFREATWEEALDVAAQGMRGRGREIAGFGSAKCSNEEAYLFQKLIRQGFGHNNVDHCTRLCHASSVAALLENVGSGAVTATFNQIENADVAIVIGANPTENHPVAATYFKQFAKRGGKLIVMDPRGQGLKRHASHMLQFKPGGDVSMLNAIMNVIVEENLYDQQYIDAFTENWPAMKAHLAEFTPEKMAPVCGIEPDVLRDVARTFAGATSAMIFWGMGVSQHIHGTDNSRCLISLALMCGQVGRPGSGLHPLRGQNNVQGASDAGLIPMFLPDYQSVMDDGVRSAFTEVWGGEDFSNEKGLTVVEIMHAIHHGDIKGMYILGENPAMSDPDVDHARAALAMLDHLVVQDIFLTETANYADVVLPASAWAEKTGTVTNTNRQVQMGRPVAPPPGEAKEDWWTIVELAKRLGLGWEYTHPHEIFAEMKLNMGSLDNITWERLEGQAVTYPSLSPEDPGQPIVFGDGFPRPEKRARFTPANVIAPDEVPDAEYPHILITGRQLEHWHTGSMTRRATVLDAVEPEANCSLHPKTLRELGVKPGEFVQLTTRRGSVSVMARADRAVAEGQVFLPFAYVEAAANILTNSALDPFGKIPEFKFSAVRIEQASVPQAAE